MNQARTIAVLRQSMARIEAGLPAAPASAGVAAVSASTGSAATGLAAVSASTGSAATGAVVVGSAVAVPTVVDTHSAAAPEFAEPTRLPVPEGLQSLFPRGLAAGEVHVFASVGAVLAAVIATLTKSGKHVAIVGLPEFGLLSVAEQGGDLSRIVCVDDPGVNPLETIGLLIDGMAAVVAHLPQAPAPSLARPIMSRLRKAQTALLFVGQQWLGARSHIDSEVVSVGGIGHGRGRIRGIQYRVRCAAKGRPEHTVLWTVGEQTALPEIGRAAEVGTLPVGVAERNSGPELTEGVVSLVQRREAAINSQMRR